MNNINIKLEPSECDFSDFCASSRVGTPQDAQLQTGDFGGRRSGYTTHRDGIEQTLLVGKADDNDDTLPTLMPIHEPRGAGTETRTRTPRKLSGLRHPASDTNLDVFYGVSNDSEMFGDIRNHTFAQETIDFKLNTVIGNQRKLLAQNEMIMDRLGILYNGNLQRGKHPNNFNGDHRNGMFQKVNRRISKEKNCLSSNNTPSPNPIAGFTENASEMRSGPPAAKVPKISTINGKQTSDFVGESESLIESPILHEQNNNFVPCSQACSSNGVLPLYANQCNMAVYVLREGEQSQLAPMVPMPVSHAKERSTQSVNGNGKMLSGQPALVYNPESKQYEPSYVTGIAHSKSSGGTRTASTTSNVSSDSAGKMPSQIVNKLPSQIQPKVTNIVSLRREPAQPVSPNVHHALVESQRLERRSKNHGSSGSLSPQIQNLPYPSPVSPILIEDIKPTTLPSPEELMHLQLRSFSMRNYAVQLMRALFRPTELIYKAVFENCERKGLDTKRVQQIKDYVFQIYPTPSQEKSLAWIGCISAMNEAIRELK